MRTFFLIAALGGFVGLAAIDLCHGDTKVAIASLCLALANGLLLT